VVIDNQVSMTVSTVTTKQLSRHDPEDTGGCEIGAYETRWAADQFLAREVAGGV
jgi:hypothetical protein